MLDYLPYVIHTYSHLKRASRWTLLQSWLEIRVDNIKETKAYIKVRTKLGHAVVQVFTEVREFKGRSD